MTQKLQDRAVAHETGAAAPGPRTPRYEQIFRLLADDIGAGRYPVGD
jgi:hypothetical protein